MFKEFSKSVKKQLGPIANEMSEDELNSFIKYLYCTGGLNIEQEIEILKETY